jgi:hypothetical protein
LESDEVNINSRGIHASTCIQTAGDMIIIPESWGHGVLNLQDSIAMASEFRHSLWRLRPAVSMMDSSAFDNGKLVSWFFVCLFVCLVNVIAIAGRRRSPRSNH